MPIRRRSFVTSTLAFLVIGLLALLCIVGTTLWLGERAQDYFNDVLKARDTRAAVVELRNALLTAETAQRGFLLTGNQIYLSPYDTAKRLAPQQLEALKSFAPSGQADVALQRLATVLDEKFRELDDTIALKRDRRDEEALAFVRTNRGKALMDEANVFFFGVMRAADEQITHSVDREKANAALLRWVSIFGGIVIVIVVGGATLSVLRHTRDLAEARDQVENKVRERTAELALANDEIRRFAHIVSHDLRAPLVNIMGFTSELEMGIASVQTLVTQSEDGAKPSAHVTEQARTAAAVDLPEAIGFIRSSTAKMNNLINAILKLSREGQRPLRSETVGLDEIVSTSAAVIQHQLSEADGEIARDLAVAWITTDRLSLEQIFGNLFDNAVKYRAKDRPLRIVVRSRALPNDRAEIEFSDNGRGIAERDLDRVFDLFKRSGQQDQPGEGIGLSYVRTVVRNLGGDISLSSVLGEGTTFRIVLPRHLTLPENPAA